MSDVGAATCIEHRLIRRSPMGSEGVEPLVLDAHSRSRFWPSHRLCAAVSSAPLVARRGSTMRRCRSKSKPEPDASESSPSPPAGLALAPHTGRLFLDRTSATTLQLTDLVTQERKLLSGDWHLFFDEGSERGALMQPSDTNDPRVLLVEDLFKYDIAVCPKGERYLVSDGNIRSAQVSLDVLMSRYSLAVVKLQVGSVSAEVDIDTFVMRRPRPGGMSIFWDAHRLYRLLGLSSYAGQPSKWAFHSLASWNKALTLFAGDHILMSKHANTSDSTLHKVPFHNRCLPTMAMSSLALLLLISRWAFAAVSSGGLRDDKARDAAAELIQSLVRQACHRGKPEEIEVVVVKDWACRWPRPAADFEAQAPVARFKLLEGGIVDLLDFLDAKAVKGCVWSQWRKKLLEAGFSAESPQLDVVAVLRSLVGVAMLRALCDQLLWALARQLERSLAEQHRGMLPEGGIASLAFESALVRVGARDMEERLLQYVLATQAASSKYQVISVATDKASPAAMSVSNTVLAFGNNVAALCCPVAIHGKPHTPAEGQSIDLWRTSGFPRQGGFAGPKLVDKQGW